MRWLFPAACVALGLFALHLSYTAYAKWQDYVALGDMSGAEAYEIEFWPEAIVGVVLIVLGGFVAGRLSRSRRDE